MQFAADLNKVQASLGSKYPITLYAIDLNKREKGEGKIPWADLNRILIKAKAAASRSCFPIVYRYTSAARKRILASNISINSRLIIQLGVNKLIFWLLI